MIKDSGNRTLFPTGAVRDISESKGRCDLLPLDVIADYFYHNGSYSHSKIISEIHAFTEDGNTDHILAAVRKFTDTHLTWNGYATSMVLDVALHMEEGCKKYGERNWQKGIPAHRYIDSGVRHLLKHIRGDTDEAHDKAFCWNMLCLCWTCKHLPELNDYKRGGEE